MDDSFSKMITNKHTTDFIAKMYNNTYSNRAYLLLINFKLRNKIRFLQRVQAQYY